MGTNTFHLLIVGWKESGYEILLRPASGKNWRWCINQNVITKEGVSRAVNALFNSKTKMDDYAVTDVFAFGTSALRNAENSGEVISKIKMPQELKQKLFRVMKKPDSFITV